MIAVAPIFNGQGCAAFRRPSCAFWSILLVFVFNFYPVCRCPLFIFTVDYIRHSTSRLVLLIETIYVAEYRNFLFFMICSLLCYCYRSCPSWKKFCWVLTNEAVVYGSAYILLFWVSHQGYYYRSIIKIQSNSEVDMVVGGLIHMLCYVTWVDYPIGWEKIKASADDSNKTRISTFFSTQNSPEGEGHFLLKSTPNSDTQWRDDVCTSKCL